jgi:hypothetical protein
MGVELSQNEESVKGNTLPILNYIFFNILHVISSTNFRLKFRGFQKSWYVFVEAEK